MSGIDRIFIRAYAKSDGSTEPVAEVAPLAPCDPASSESRDADDGGLSTAPESTAPSVVPPSTVELYSDAPPADATSDAHYRFLHASHGTVPTTSGPHTAPSTGSTRLGESSEPAVPLSSLASTLTPAAEVAESAQPMLQVDRFRWPTVCELMVEAAAQQFAGVADALAQAAAGGHKVYLITGSRRGEGRTSLVLSLARLLAALDRRVALVEGDAANPQLARRLNIRPQLGWDAVVRGSEPLGEVLIESIADGLVLCPLAEKAEDADELCGGFRFDLMLRQLRDQYEIVLVDGPPAELSPSARLPLAESARLDASLIVQDTRNATPTDAIEAQLRAARIELVGVVENFVSDNVLCGSA